MDTHKTTFIKEIEVKDPDTGQINPVEIHKDNHSNGIFGISSTFTGQVTDKIPSPFNDDITLELEHPEESHTLNKE